MDVGFAGASHCLCHACKVFVDGVSGGALTGGPFPGGGPGFGPGGGPGGGAGPDGARPGGGAGGFPGGGNGVPGGMGFTGTERVGMGCDGLPGKSDSKYTDLGTGPARDIPHLLPTSFRGVPSPESSPSIQGSPVRRALGPLGRASNFGRFCTRGVRIGIPSGPP